MPISHNRTCAVCHKQYDPKEMIRISKHKDGSINFDALGRGTYICKNEQFETVKRNKVLNRAFHVDVDQAVYDELKKRMEERHG